jgi:hypothetical protein
MANRLITWVWNSKVGDVIAKVILLHLADQARADGTTFVSQKTLSEDTEIPRRTIQRKLPWLEEKGWLSIEVRRRHNGGRSTNLHRLLAPPEYLRPSSDDDADPSATVAHGGAPSSGAGHAPRVAQLVTQDSTPSGSYDPSGSRLGELRFEEGGLFEGAGEGLAGDVMLNGIVTDGQAQDLVALARMFRAARLDDLAVKYLTHSEFDRGSRTLTARLDFAARQIFQDVRARQLLAQQQIALCGPTWRPPGGEV